MAKIQAIRARISSVESSAKITKAVEMIAAARYKKTETAFMNVKPNLQHTSAIMARLIAAKQERLSEFVAARPCRRVGVIVLSTDRGLCGGLNSQLFRMLLSRINTWQATGIEV